MSHKPYKLEPLPSHEAHERALERLKNMSVEEFKARLVHHGVYTRDGQLTREYGGELAKTHEGTQDVACAEDDARDGVALLK